MGIALRYRVPKKDARFLKVKNISDLLSDDKDDKLMGNFDF